MMTSHTHKISIELSKEESLVFFDWLNKFNDSNLDDVDPIEKQVLFNIECYLEKVLVEPLDANYREYIKQAKEVLRNSTG